MSPDTRTRLGWIVGLAVALRLATLAIVSDVPVDPTAADEGNYLHLAQRVADGDGLTNDDGSAAVFRPPLYPLFLGQEIRLQRAIGLDDAPDRLVPGLLNTLTAAGVVALTGILGRRYVGERGGLIAAGILAVWPNQVAVVGNLTTEQLYTPLFVAATALVLAPPRRTPLAGLLTGALLGAATLARPASWPLIVAAIALGAWGARRRDRVLHGLAVLVTAAVVIAPWLLHVRDATGRMFLVAAQGQNLCIGNNDRANGHFQLDIADCEWPPGRFADPAADEELFDRAVDWIVANPERQPLLVVRRALNVVLGDSASIVAYLPAQDQEIGARPSSPGALVLVAVSTIVGTALLAVGAWAVVLRWRRGGMWSSPAGRMILWAAASCATALVTFGDGRYHDPLAPLVCIAVAWLVMQQRTPEGGAPSVDRVMRTERTAAIAAPEQTT